MTTPRTGACVDTGLTQLVTLAVHEVTRYDAATLGRATRTPQGFLRARARLTRVGVLPYRQKDGSVRRELRRPEQVFAPASLATLSDAPLTDLHPKLMVSPDNARELTVGHVSSGSIRADGRFLEGDIIVTDSKMIEAVEGRNRREVSCGYRCKLREVGGVWNGERYDCEQVDIVYNHAGLGPQNWGRAGSECGVRLDGGAVDDGNDLAEDEGWRTDADDAPDGDDDRKDGSDMEMVVIKVDGIDCNVAPVSAQLLTKALEQRDASLVQARTDAQAAKVRTDALQGELDGVKVKLTEATDAKRFDTAVQERIALLDRARAILGGEVKLDGKTAREIKELCVTNRDSKADMGGKSDDYVQARFDTLDVADGGGKSPDLDAARKQTRLDGGAAGGNNQQQQQRADGGAKYVTPAWRQPLAVSKSV